MELKKQAVHGAIWVFAEQFGSQLIGFVLNLILARILMPADFGTIALFGIVMSIGNVLVQGGMSSSLIRNAQNDERDYSTVFWFNIASAILIYLVIYLIAPLFARFYEVEILTSLIRVFSLILIIDSFAMVQGAKFVKELDFKKNFKIQLPSLLIGGACGVYFAMNGYGVWSLVYYSLIQNSIFMIQHWMYSSWRPSFAFDMQKFKYHFGFGVNMTLSALLEVIFSNLYSIIIGKKYSTEDLGYYNRADSLKQLPISNIATTLNKVTFPLFAKIGNDDERLRHSYRELQMLVMFVIAPLVGIMIVAAEPLIRFLYTDKWLPAVPYFKILCIAGLLYPIHAYNLNILQIKGRSDLFLRLEVIKKIIIVVVIAVCLNFGIIALVWGQVFISILSLFVNTYYTGRYLNYPIYKQLYDLSTSILIASSIGIGLWLLDGQYLVNQSDLLRILTITVIFLVLYMAVSVMMKRNELKLIKALIKR